MTFRVQTTLCPSCHRNVPRETEICVLCGSPTYTSNHLDLPETPKAPIRAYRVDLGGRVVQAVELPVAS